MTNAKFLQEGDIIEISNGHKVYAMVPEHFVYSNKRGNFNLTRSDVVVGGELDYLAGRYVVTKTALDGGGYGHGKNDVYPNGHHVYCVKIDDPEFKIDFYQSGAFTAMIKDITPVGRAEAQIVYKPVE